MLRQPTLPAPDIGFSSARNRSFNFLVGCSLFFEVISSDIISDEDELENVNVSLSHVVDVT